MEFRLRETALVPIPLTPSDCGLLTALSVKVRLALRVPMLVGVKVTLIVQLAPTARLEPQLLDWAKSLLLAPVRAMAERFKVAVPELVRVTAWEALVTPAI